MKRILAAHRIHFTAVIVGVIVTVLAATGLTAQIPDGARLDRLVQHLTYLASEELGGRMTGTEGERLATEYVAQQFQAAGLETSFQEFEFVANVSLGAVNTLALAGGAPFALDQEWRPLGFSANGESGELPVVFAGYGIQAPAEAGLPEYNSYRQMDPLLVKDKWVLVLRYLPEGVAPEQKIRLSRYSSLEYKAAIARDLGARGILIVTGPNALVRDQLVGLKLSAGNAPGFFGVSVSDRLGQQFLDPANFSLKELQDQLDQGEWLRPFEIPSLRLAANVELLQHKSRGRNVLGLLRAPLNLTGDPASVARSKVVVGAHVDHLGVHDGDGQIYLGADDNASGVSALIEVATSIAVDAAAADVATLHEGAKHGRSTLKKDILFVAWSGEELGLRGSQHFVEELKKQGPVYPAVSSYFNFDMVGRLRERLYIQGVGSSLIWPAAIARARVARPEIGEIAQQSDPYLPTDSTSFYLSGVPILAAYTGTHPEYHTPFDQVATINFLGIAQTAALMQQLILDQASTSDIPDYVRVERTDGGNHSGYRATLGVMPDYSAEGVVGLRVLGTRAGSPAEIAGVRPGDVIVRLAGKEIRNIHDYMFALNIVKIREPNVLMISREGSLLELVVIPEPKE